MKDLEYKFNRFMFRFSAGDRKRLWQKLAKLISNGVPILEALQSIYDRRVAAGQAKHPTSVALREWVDKLRNGSRLSDAIQGWVEHDEQMLISAGEQSGAIETALESASEIMQAKKAIRGAVIKGLAYPTFMMLMALAVLIMFSYKIIPEFSRVVPDDKWHGIARVIIDFSNFMRDWLPIIIGLVILTIVAFVLSLPRWSEGLRIKFDRYPPYSIYRMLMGSTWMISFAALVNAGVRIENALQKLSENSSDWMSARVQACLRGMRSGLSVGDALAKTGYGFPDSEIIDDLGVYARLSGFDQALSIIGREWIDTSVDNIKEMMGVIFSVAILLVGGLIAFMVGGLIGMELQMSDILRGINH